jgi:hypothetical protein
MGSIGTGSKSEALIRLVGALLVAPDWWLSICLSVSLCLPFHHSLSGFSPSDRHWLPLSAHGQWLSGLKTHRYLPRLGRYQTSDDRWFGSELNLVDLAGSERCTQAGTQGKQVCSQLYVCCV